jgi:hypothetical protein
MLPIYCRQGRWSSSRRFAAVKVTVVRPRPSELSVAHTDARPLRRVAKPMPDDGLLSLGSAASEGVEWLIRRGYLTQLRVLHGRLQPGKAGAERGAYFLGEKARSALSVTIGANSLSAACDGLLKPAAALP